MSMDENSLLPLDNSSKHAVELITSHAKQSVSNPLEAANVRQHLALFIDTVVTAASKSKNTQRSYYTGLATFFQFLGEEQEDLLQRIGWYPLAEVERFPGQKANWHIRGQAVVVRLVQSSTLDRYRDWLLENNPGLSSSTLSHRINIVRTMLRVAMRDGILLGEQSTNMGLKPYKTRQTINQKTTGRRLSAEEVKLLRETVRQIGRSAYNRAREERKSLVQNKPIRDLAIINIMLYMGLRTIEIRRIHLEDFFMDQGKWHLLAHGKGDKDRSLPVHPEALKGIQDWISQANKHLTKRMALGAGKEHLFHNLRPSGHISTYSLGKNPIPRFLAKYGAVSGIAAAEGKNRLAPHDLRRTFGRRAFDNGAPILAIQKAYGHADVSTTMRYIGVDDQDTHAVIFSVED
jgi:site-specific recombinase XerD